MITVVYCTLSEQSYVCRAVWLVYYVARCGMFFVWHSVDFFEQGVLQHIYSVARCGVVRHVYCVARCGVWCSE